MVASTSDCRPRAVARCALAGEAAPDARSAVGSCNRSAASRNAASTCTTLRRSSASSSGRWGRSVPSSHSPGCSRAGTSSSKSLSARYPAYAAADRSSASASSEVPSMRSASSSLRALATLVVARTRSTSSISSSRDSLALRLRSAATTVLTTREPTSSRTVAVSVRKAGRVSPFVLGVRSRVGRLEAYAVGRRNSAAVSFGDGSR